MAKTKSRKDEFIVKDLNVTKLFRINGTDIFAQLDGLLSTVAELNILDGATLDVGELNTLTGITAIVSELNLLDNQAASVTYVIGAEVGDDINLGIQFKDAAGVDMATPVSCRWYLSDDTAGLDPATAAPDGGGVIGTDGAMIESVANLSGMLVSEADGAVDIDWTDAGTLTKYMVIVMPNGSLQISAAMTWAA